jgi:phospholipase/carboxylesterase
VLIRAMVPLAEPPATSLNGKPVLLLSGAVDPIVPEENAARLAAQLRNAGATVEHRTLPVGHGLSQADLTLAARWLGQR